MLAVVVVVALHVVMEVGPAATNRKSDQFEVIQFLFRQAGGSVGSNVLHLCAGVANSAGIHWDTPTSDSECTTTAGIQVPVPR